MERPCVRLKPYATIRTGTSLEKDYSKIVSRAAPIEMNRPSSIMPIEDFETYAHTRRSAQDPSFTRNREESMRLLYKRDTVEKPPDKQEAPSIPDDPLYAVCRIRVTESGFVKVKLSVPMEVIYEKNKKLQKPTVKELVEAMCLFGYSTPSIQSMVRRSIKKRECLADADDACETRVVKKSKPKKGTVYQEIASRLNFRMRVEVHDIFENFHENRMEENASAEPLEKELFGEADETMEEEQNQFENFVE